MQAVVTAPRAAQTHNLHRAGGRFGVAFVLARLAAGKTLVRADLLDVPPKWPLERRIRGQKSP